MLGLAVRLPTPVGASDGNTRATAAGWPDQVVERSALATRLHALVDALAVRAHRGAGLRRLGDRKHFAAPGDHMRAHHSTFRDLFLAHVVEHLRRVVAGGFGALRPGVHLGQRLRTHAHHDAIVTTRVSDEVADALASGRPVVALETPLLAHGLPPGRNQQVGERLERTVREHGAVPATIAVLDGRPVVGRTGD